MSENQPYSASRDHEEGHGPRAKSKWAWVPWVVGAVLLGVALIVLHLTGVLGAEAHA